MRTRYAAGRDFGGVRRFGVGHIVIAVVVITAAAGLIAFQLVRDRDAAIATAKAWDVQGPPCPALGRAEFQARRYTAPKTFDYDGILIGRVAGDVSCSDVKANGGRGLETDKACQFTSPAVVTVTSRAGAFFFVPGAGHPATLHIHQGVPSCVMASNFTLQSE